MIAKVKHYPFYIAVFLFAAVLMLPGGCNDNNGGSHREGDPGEPSCTPIDSQAPLSSVMQTRLVNNNGTGTFNIPDYVKAIVRLNAKDSPAPNLEFPLAVDPNDGFREVDGLSSSVVLSWLDPLTNDEPGDEPRF